MRSTSRMEVCGFRKRRKFSVQPLRCVFQKPHDCRIQSALVVLYSAMVEESAIRNRLLSRWGENDFLVQKGAKINVKRSSYSIHTTYWQVQSHWNRTQINKVPSKNILGYCTRKIGPSIATPQTPTNRGQTTSPRTSTTPRLIPTVQSQ